MKKYEIDKEFFDGTEYLDAEIMEVKKNSYVKEITVIKDWYKKRPMAWIRAENIINAVVYLDHYDLALGEGSRKYNKEIVEVLEELKLYELSDTFAFGRGRSDNVLVFMDGEGNRLF